MTRYFQYTKEDKEANAQGNQYELCKAKLFKDNKNNILTELILREKMMFFVAILSDKDGNRSHAVGIDAEK